MTVLGERVARALELPLTVLARKASQRGRALGHRLVASPSRAWPADAASPELLRTVRDGATPRFFVSHAERRALVDTLRCRDTAAVAAILRAADEACAHRFDILGSGPVQLGETIDWHLDFKSACRWELRHHTVIDYIDPRRPSDVKVVWELSRCHHWVTLGQAYWLTGDTRYVEEFLAQWNSWMADNPLSFGVNWTCAMEAAVRAVNWLWAFFLFAEAPGFDEARQRRFLGALVGHARFIERNLEVGPLPGNHYLTDGIGLLALGLLLPGCRGARRWVVRGRRIVWGEALRQITPDGVDYEHALGYHVYVLECLLFALTLCRRNGVEVPREASARIERMLEFTAAAIRPDGSLAAIGDADGGILVDLAATRAPDPRALLAAGAVILARPDLKAVSRAFGAANLWWLGLPGLEAWERLPEGEAIFGSRAFTRGGFWVMRARDRHLIVSGPGSGPASHMHHDLLSFECWADGVRYVVDPGTYTYTASREWRNRFRATAAHNTIAVDGQEQTRLLDDPGLFPINGDPAVRFTLHDWRTSTELDRFDAEHTGYSRLPGVGVHRRTIWFDRPAGTWAVRDVVSGRGLHRVTGFLHLAPLAVAVADRDPWVVRVGEGRRTLWIAWCTDRRLVVSIAEGWIAPRYGLLEKAPIVTYEATAELPMELRFVIVPTQAPDAPELARLLGRVEKLA